jgi:hypothetical protein
MRFSYVCAHDDIGVLKVCAFEGGCQIIIFKSNLGLGNDIRA